MLGQVVAGRYRLDARLGEGAMGAVFVSTRLDDGLELAVKLMHSRLTRDEVVAERFDREVLAATRLRHRNCVQVIDGGTTDDGTKFLVMPRLVGAELRCHMRGPMEAARVVGIIDQVLQGLEHAHGLGFVHRDVKPENVFISEASPGALEPGLVKLLDFGLVKLLEPPPGRAPLTREGFVFGTPAYMSPEQAAGQRVDARADLYGVGVMMYEMLAGEPPFQADEAVVLLRRHMLMDPPRLPAHVPAPLAAYVMRLLQKEPSDRFASAADARAALASALRASRAPAERARPSVASVAASDLSWTGASLPMDEVPEGSLIRSTRREGRAFAVVAIVLGLAAGIFALALPSSSTLEPTETPALPSASLAAASAAGSEIAEVQAPDPTEDLEPAESPVLAAAIAPRPPNGLEEVDVVEIPAPIEPIVAPAEPIDPAPPKTSRRSSTRRPPAPKATPKPEPTPKPTVQDPPKVRVLSTDRPPRPEPSPTSKLPTGRRVAPSTRTTPAVRHVRPTA